MVSYSLKSAPVCCPLPESLLSMTHVHEYALDALVCAEVLNCLPCELESLELFTSYQIENKFLKRYPRLIVCYCMLAYCESFYWILKECKKPL